MTRRRIARRAVLLVALAALAPACGGSDDVGDTQPSIPSVSAAQTAAGRTAPDAARIRTVDALLDQRERAVRTGEFAPWEATIAPDDDALAEREAASFQSLQRLPLVEWSATAVQAQPGPAGRIRATAEIRYRLDGDDQPATVTWLLDLVDDGAGGLRVAGSTATPLPPWELAGVAAAEGDHALVIGNLPQDDLERFAAEADVAAEAVTDLTPQRQPPRLVVLLPSDWTAGQRLIGSVGDRTGLAALTTVLEPPGAPNGPLRIVADPAVLDRLDDANRGALLAHEAFHVATPHLAGIPLWLSEGLADHAGYRRSGIPLDRAVAGLLVEARRNGAPDQLPADPDFSPGPAATTAYEGAHLAVRMLVDRYGEQRVMALAERVALDGNDHLDQALREELGTDLATVTAAWRAEVTSRAAA